MWRRFNYFLMPLPKQAHWINSTERRRLWRRFNPTATVVATFQLFYYAPSNRPIV